LTLSIPDYLLPYAVAGVLWAAVIAYALFAGADFGGGIWDLLASGPRREEQRRSVARAMGPVWEANHVWLIFMITGLFTAFPSVFSLLAIRLYVPFSLILVGIVFRGASFVFRAHASEQSRSRIAWGSIFGIASLITPFLLGACAGAVASGEVASTRCAPAACAIDLGGWTTPFALVCGALALAICAGLAAAYLTVEEEALGHTRLAGDFRARALLAGTAAALLSALALPLAASTAPRLWAGLTGRAAPLTIAAAGYAVIAATAMLLRRYRLARVAAASQVVAILSGWAVAQYPDLVPPNLSVTATAAPPETMALLLITFTTGGALLLPSLLLLFRVFKGRNPAAL
jgi:cytochrome d ubiquinol oxidase subunit II